MRIRIHRGANEVGGNCVEIEASDGSRIALDVGLPLNAEPGQVTAPTFGGPLLGIVISHPHLDHYGLAAAVTPPAPVYIGAEAARLLDAAAFFSPITRPLRATGHLQDRAAFRLGPFVITPYLVDHSGFDSYSLLVEADGRRLFYTGDFRGHGRKGRLFDELLADPPQPIDALITEGTQVGGVDHSERTERELEDELASICKQRSGLVAVFGSAQNLDRLVTAYRAARRSGRILVTDLYGATVAAATRSTIPQPGFEAYRVYVPQRQRVLVKQSGQFHRVNDIRVIRMFGDTLARERSRLLTYLPASTVPELVACGGLDPAGIALWSMWDGYLDAPSGVRFVDTLRSTGIPLRSLHTSGHATVADIRRFITALAPTQVVPIHTDSPAAFGAVCQSAVLHANGSWWAV